MVDVLKAWTDTEYFDSLTDAQKAEVPANPAGSVDLSIADLGSVSGARMAASCTGCCCCYSTMKCSAC